METSAWFYDSYFVSSGIEQHKKIHRQAYERSLKSKCAVKVAAGEYYYRGFEISRDGGRECPWNYGRPEDFGHESASTKREAMDFIDVFLLDS